MRGPVICGIEDAKGAGLGRVAYELAERFGLPLLNVHVLDRTRSDEQAAKLVRAMTVSGSGDVIIDKGHHPGDRLVALAREREASFLVIGNRGPRSSLLGSVSADIARRAPCPVLVVPHHLTLATPQAGTEDRETSGRVVRLGPARAANSRIRPRVGL
jgi:nucleotide-binding universal stress UspA family protein